MLKSSYKSDKFIYTKIVAADLEWARNLHNDPDVLSMLTDPSIVSQDEQVLWFSRLCTSASSTRLVVWKEEQRIGLIRIDRLDYNNHNVCIGLDIVREARGKGYARDIYKDMFRIFFYEEGMNRIWLLVAAYNDKARHIYKSLGFTEEGIQRQALYKNGIYSDYILMGLLRDDYIKGLKLQQEKSFG